MPQDSTVNSKTWTLENQSWFYFSRTDKEIGTTSSGEGNTTLFWLVENTRVNSKYPSNSSTNFYGDGDDDDYYGYWTLSPSATSTNAYFIRYGGNFNDYEVNDNTMFGLRPVITISKSELN